MVHVFYKLKPFSVFAEKGQVSCSPLDGAACAFGEVGQQKQCATN